MMLDRLKDPDFHRGLAWGVLYLSPVIIFLLLVAKPSTYGKLHNSKSNWFGPSVTAKWCWMVFEAPNCVWVLVSLASLPSYNSLALPNGLLLGWFLLHYIHRSIIYPLNMSSNSKFPIGIIAVTVPYCTVNGYLQAEGLCRFQEFPPDHVYSVRFVLGLVITLLGFMLGYFSDLALLRLRRTGTYHIPRGGGFDMLAISCPHFLGEIIEWFGFCVACNFSVASLSFAVWTAANLVPRGLAQHEWYHQKFEEYPKDRKAILPLLL